MPKQDSTWPAAICWPSQDELGGRLSNVQMNRKLMICCWELWCDLILNSFPYLSDTTHSTSELCFLKAFSAQSWRFAGQGSKGSAPKEKERHHDHRSGGCWKNQAKSAPRKSYFMRTAALYLPQSPAQSWRFAGQGSKGSAPKEKERHHDHRSGGCWKNQAKSAPRKSYFVRTAALRLPPKSRAEGDEVEVGWGSWAEGGQRKTPAAFRSHLHVLTLPDTTHSTSELCFLKAFSAQSWRFAGQGSKGSAPKEKERHHDHRSGGCWKNQAKSAPRKSYFMRTAALHLPQSPKTDSRNRKCSQRVLMGWACQCKSQIPTESCWIWLCNVCPWYALVIWTSEPKMWLVCLRTKLLTSAKTLQAM